MKLCAVVLLAMAGARARSSSILLNCNTSGGPDQQFVVENTSSGLTLKELTTSGAWVSRSLSAEEWAAQQFELRVDEFGDHTTVSKSGGRWRYDSPSAVGYADCD